MFIHELDLLNFEQKNSVVRKVFDKKISLDDFEITEYSPRSFKDRSFVPSKGLNLSKLNDYFTVSLKKLNSSLEYIKETIPGIIEAIKNSYEHGNLEDNSKKITLLEKLNSKEVSYIVGDQGGKIDGNLFSYVNMIRTKKSLGKQNEIESFYSFCGESYAPLGHSGVGSIVMHKCFDEVLYFKNKEGGLSVLLSKPFSQMR
jgi:anti-sigma regulatory factor (Ser/Thr protein kinase)